MRHHPWRVLREQHPGWRVHFVPSLPWGALGMTRWGDHTVWLVAGLSQVERRCVFAHELQHIVLDERECDVAGEARVERATARALIPLTDLLDALRWSRHPREVADTLWVTLDVLRCRFAHLHPAERAAVTEVLRHHHAA